MEIREETARDIIARLTRENYTLMQQINESYPPAIYKITPVQRDYNDPYFYSKVAEPIQQNDLNLAQHYLGLDMIPRDIKTKADLMQFLAKAADPSQLAYTICALAADLEKVGRDSVNMKIQNYEIYDYLVLEQEQLISALERKLVEKYQKIREQTVELSVNAKNALVDRNAGGKNLQLM